MANETIADIIAEMRIFKCRNLETGELEVCNATANYFADRLEAAHRRERGNSAALRMAVKDAYDKLLLWNYTDGDTARMALGVMNKLDAALAAPPRNCDRFATKFDAKHEWEKVCKAGLTEQGPFEDWIFSPVTEKKGGKDENK